MVVTNESRDPKRICVQAYIEGLSAKEEHTVEIERGKQTTFKLLPTLLPERAQTITEVQRHTLHVLAEDLDGKTELHETYPIVCLARTSSFNSVVDPETRPAPRPDEVLRRLGHPQRRDRAGAGPPCR